MRKNAGKGKTSKEEETEGTFQRKATDETASVRHRLVHVEGLVEVGTEMVLAVGGTGLNGQEWERGCGPEGLPQGQGG